MVHPSQRDRARLIWMAGNLLMLFGVYLLFYVGGLYANASYNRWAARGDSELPAPPVVRPAVAEPAPFVVPVLVQANTSGQVVGPPPVSTAVNRPSTVSRLILPSINVDSKVVEVGWDVVEQDGAQIAVWQVAEYAVGQHKGSANPGEGDNVVLAGHVGGYGKVFKDLFYLQPGDTVIVYSDDSQYRYVVRERLVVQEEGVSAEQRAANAQYIASTGEEMITMVTCWPASGPDKFTQRVIVRAVPYDVRSTSTQTLQSGFTIR
jgi:sortase A